MPCRQQTSIATLSMLILQILKADRSVMKSFLLCATLDICPVTAWMSTCTAWSIRSTLSNPSEFIRTKLQDTFCVAACCQLATWKRLRPFCVMLELDLLMVSPSICALPNRKDPIFSIRLKLVQPLTTFRSFPFSQFRLVKVIRDATSKEKKN